MSTFLRPALYLFLSLGVYVPGTLSAQAPAQAERCESHPPHLHANLWMQTSAEYQALCHQTFNAALNEVKQAVRSAKVRGGRPVGSGKKPLAVVADLDETILDNARFQSEMDTAVSFNCKDRGYSPERWKQWEKENADEVGLVPGAGSFISEVEKLKVVMVYLSNRLEEQKESTIRALAHNGVNTQGLWEGTERLLLKRETSNKQDRIRLTEEKYQVVAYLGDNLADFPGATEETKDVAKLLAARLQKMESAATLWGTRWFMLPNPVYGDWEHTLPTTVSERIQLLRHSSRPGFAQVPNLPQ